MYHYLIPFLSGELEYLIDMQSDFEGIRAEEIENSIRRSAMSIVKFFEETSGLLISGITENAVKDEYGIISQRDSDYRCKELHWKHPLANDLKEIDLIF